MAATIETVKSKAKYSRKDAWMQKEENRKISIFAPLFEKAFYVAALIVGAVVFLVYFIKIQHVPDVGADTYIWLILLAGITGGVIFLAFSLLLIFPGWVSSLLIIYAQRRWGRVSHSFVMVNYALPFLSLSILFVMLLVLFAFGASTDRILDSFDSSVGLLFFLVVLSIIGVGVYAFINRRISCWVFLVAALGGAVMLFWDILILWQLIDTQDATQKIWLLLAAVVMSAMANVTVAVGLSDSELEKEKWTIAAQKVVVSAATVMFLVFSVGGSWSFIPIAVIRSFGLGGYSIQLQLNSEGADLVRAAGEALTNDNVLEAGLEWRIGEEMRLRLRNGTSLNLSKSHIEGWWSKSRTNKLNKQ